ncbi:MAG: hypothetical protein ABJO67_03405 [Pseudoruegeria sp.]
MAVSQEDIDALESAINRGVRKVKQGDEEVEYQSISDMRQTLRHMRAQLAGQSTARVRAIYPTTSRGL